MVNRAVHPAHAVDDIQQEVALPLERSKHVHWLLHACFLNPLAFRAMFARRGVATSAERHGNDTNGWPSLATVLPPPRAQKPQTAPPHRGSKAIPAAPEAPEKDEENGRSPSVVILDWALGRKSSPAPKPPQRPATTPPPIIVLDLLTYENSSHKPKEEART